MAIIKRWPYKQGGHNAEVPLYMYKNYGQSSSLYLIKQCYSNGAMALLLKLLTGEKYNGGNWLFKSNCEHTV